MKLLLIACLGAFALAQQPQGPGPFVRQLRADLLRDFPGFCFSSTNFNLFLPGQTWPLLPFCGEAKCVQEGDNLVEAVRDCGPQPKQNERCVIANLAQLQRNDTVLPYPQCCPVYQCPEGVTLEYPTPQEIEAASQQQKAAAVEAARENARARQAAQQQGAGGRA